ncbi:BTAD domain-containing putative transcriptional regulator [Micromonospora parva]|uniref:AfsR/SARP family transcriptional regulator n=1 Tax=Micromonospora parva TaxID=1464048 RepID=UPI0033DEA28B
MEFRVLGPVGLWLAGNEVDLGPARQRCVLAALLLNDGKPLSTEAAIARVWGEDAPARSKELLYIYMSRLRKALRAANGVQLRRSSGGYLLDVPQNAVDASLFTRLTAEATTGTSGDGGGLDPATRVRLFRSALALWRGTPLDGLSGAWTEGTREHLRRRRLKALENCFDLELQLGNHSALVNELSDLVDLHPTVEPLVGQLMLALYRSGRQASALAAFRDTRKLLVDDYGLEPGPALRQLEHAILVNDPSLDLQTVTADTILSVTAGPDTAPAVPIPTVPSFAVAVPGALVERTPQELPADVTGFAGRATEIAALNSQLTDSVKQPSMPAGVTLITGTAGVGKTALAVHWAHQVSDRFPDGQLYVNLRGYSTDVPISPVQALGCLLRSLGVPTEQIPVDVAEAAALYRSLMAGRRALILLDNARSVAQVRPLLPGRPGCLVLVTSRDRLGGLIARDGAQQLALKVLDAGDACQLLSQVIGVDRGHAERRAVGELAEVCAYLPLALRIAAANINGRPLHRIADHVVRLRRDDHLMALAVEGDEETAVGAAFDASYESIPPAAQRMFRLLGLVPGPDFTAPAAAALAVLDPDEAGRVLERLADAHLISEHAAGRFAFHDLLRRYARARAVAEDGEADRAAAVRRLFDWYLHKVDAAAIRLYPQRFRLPIPETDRTLPIVDFPDPAGALHWLDAERRNLIEAAQHAVTQRGSAAPVGDSFRYAA